MLDEIDRQIVALLQANGRASHAELGRAVGLTASSVYERVRKLEERGVILGYRALVDPAALGQIITAFVRVRQMADVRPFERAVLAESNVLECHDITGDDCYIVKVHARDTAELHAILQRLRAAAGNVNTVTSIVLHTVKENSPIVVNAVELEKETRDAPQPSREKLAQLQ